MITTDATVLMRNSDEEKVSENHKKKTAKIQEKSEQKINEHLTYQEWFM